MNDFNEEVNTICMPLISSYFNNAVRPFIEGKAILKTNTYLKNVRKIGDPNNNDVSMFVASCTQCSNIFATPHNLTVTYKRTENKLEGTCSCIGSADGRCKHICAMMMFLKRADSVQIASCTDVQCEWSQESLRELYVPIPISEYCHVGISSDKNIKKMKFNGAIGEMPNDDDSIKIAALTETHDILNEAFPQSAYILQKMTRETNVDIQSDSTSLSLASEDLISLLSENVLPFPLSSWPELDDKIEVFYEGCVNTTVMKAVEICQNTCNQRYNQTWFQERKVRITGSIAHQLFS